MLLTEISMKIQKDVSSLQPREAHTCLSKVWSPDWF